MSDPYQDFVEARLFAGDAPEEIARKVGEAVECPTCPFCKTQPATLLCDFIIGFEWKGDMADDGQAVVLKDGRREWRRNGKQYRVAALDGEMFTCDRPVCTRCATNRGWMHVKGSEEHPELSGFQSRDHCPQCKDRPGDGLRRLTSEEASTIRRAMWKESSGLLRLLPTL